MIKYKDLEGKKFGRWVVIKFLENSHGKWLCKCSCEKGIVKEVYGVNLVKGISKSCGCYMREKATSDSTTHGLSNTKLYYRWLDMHQRCYNSKYKRYKDWGGRGIKVCERWNKCNPQGFLNYYDDISKMAGKETKDFTLDRIDNDKDYCPENVRWASKKDQRLNQRSYRIKYYECEGVVKTQKEWANFLNIHASNIIYWFKRGKDFSWVYNHYLNMNREVCNA
jgi:hypothetical protein